MKHYYIMLKIESTIAYLFDGLANASSVLVGQAVGEKNKQLLKLTIRCTLEWCLILGSILTVVYDIWHVEIIQLFTNLKEIIEVTLIYDKWLLISSLLGGLGLSLYGIFTSTMATKAVRNSTLLSMLLFLVIAMTTMKQWGNHSLWLAYILFYFGRGVFLLPYLKQSFKQITDKV